MTCSVHKKLDHRRLLELLSYNPKTGIFIWKKDFFINSKTRIGKKAGYCYSKIKKRIYIDIDAVRYPAHRLAWFYYYKKWPKIELDHINRNDGDNRISNLRECNRSQNMCNTLRKNSSGVKGVYKHKVNNSWVAEVWFERRKHNIGSFKTKEEAAIARAIAAYKIQGNFARAA